MCGGKHLPPPLRLAAHGRCACVRAVVRWRVARGAWRVARGAWRVARAQLGAAFCLCVRLQRQPSTSSLLSSLRT